MTQGYQYKGCGLDYVYLLNGYTEHETEYGRGVSIHDVDNLHKAIACEVITSRRRLRGQEVRFLRSLLDGSQGGLARILGVTRASVARWEAKPTSPIPATADRLLRVVYAAKARGDENVKELLDLLEQVDERTYQASLFEEADGHWKHRRAA